MASLGLHITLILPQLDILNQTWHDGLQALGDRMADSLQAIRDEVAQLKTDMITAIDEELVQVTEAIRTAAEDPAEIRALADDIAATRESLKQRVMAMVPETPPAPEPTPTP